MLEIDNDIIGTISKEITSHLSVGGCFINRSFMIPLTYEIVLSRQVKLQITFHYCDADFTQNLINDIKSWI